MYPPVSFNPKHYIDLCEALLCQDETLMALKILDMVPGYFRDHYPVKLLELKRDIQAKIATASFYSCDAGCELETTDETCANYIGTLRAQLIVQDVKVCNDNGYKPVIIDHAPGENWLPIVLEKQGLNFWYKPIYVNHPSNEKFRYRYERFLPENNSMIGLANAPVIYSCCEVVEHLHEPKEIRFDMERNVGKADAIHCSTPKYTFNPNVTDWRLIGDLGHLRTWTPNEFQEFIRTTFPDYIHSIYDSQVLHARLVNDSTKCEYLKINYKLES
jgi:hypothetical protein